MGNRKSKSVPNFVYTNNGEGKFEAASGNLEFGKRWEVFIQSLDVNPENVRQIDRLEQDQKEELLQNFEAKHTHCSSFHYVSLIKGLHVNPVTRKKSHNKTDNNPVHVLSATEVSLRTNNVEWVYEFLNNDGLETLLQYMSRSLTLFLDSNFKNIKIETLVSADKKGSYESLLPSAGSLERRHSAICTLLRACCLVKMLKSGPVTNESLKNSIHQSLKCLRTIFNNQRGCEMAFEHRRAINVIALCLLHPSYQTKTLVLDILSAVCMIDNGLKKVLSAFDYFRRVTDEKKRFEKLVMYLQEHETLSVDDYNIDFMVSCTQFINIIVHSGEDINLRVFLQQEFTLLGLDDFYKTLQEKSGDRLKKQLKAYIDNHVDVALLAEEIEAKEAISSDIERLQQELLSVEKTYQEKIIQMENKITELLENVVAIKAEKESQQNEYNILRSKLLEPQTVTEREATLQNMVDCLEGILNEKNILFESQKINSTGAILPSPQPVACPPPPGPPPPQNAAAAPPPPPPHVAPLMPGAPPPLAGSLILGNSSQAMSIRPPIQTKCKMPIFNWTVLKTPQLKGTIFVQMDDEHLYDRLEFNYFEEVFKLNSSDSTHQNGVVSMPSFSDHTIKRRPDKKSLMDPNRHRCIGVLLRFLEQDKLNSDALIKAINQLDVNVEVAERILCQLPSSDDVKTYRKYEYSDHLSVDELSDEDKLLLRLCKVDRLSQKLEVVLYMQNFQETFNELCGKVTAVTRASLAVRTSQKLSQILEIVLAYGNYMNSSRRGIMYGYRLQSLDLLTETKSVDKTWSLLQFYASIIEKQFPELITFVDEMNFLEPASKVPMEAITADVQCLVTGMKQVKEEMAFNATQPDSLRKFFEKHEKSAKKLETDAQTCKETFLQSAEWFGERQNNPTPDQFFGILNRFTENFKRAIDDNAKRGQTLVRSSVVELSTKMKRKDSMVDQQELLKKIAQEARKKNKRFVNRTRQINSDGMMDGILADLGKEPLQAEIHGKRQSQS